MTQGRRYYIEYDNLSHHNILNMIINFYQLYDKMNERKELVVYTSLPKNDDTSGEKKLKITDLKKSQDGWEPFDIGKAMIIFETKNNDYNLSRYYDGYSYDGKYYIKLKISPTYTPFYQVYTDKKVFNKRYNYYFTVKHRVYTVAREQSWGDLYRNETNPSIWEKVVYFFQDLF